jgi:hypothetical protein
MSQSDPEDRDSVTSLAGPSVVRERAPQINPGDVIAGRYQVEAIIGKGGSGIVLRAFDRTAQMPVALKVLRPDLAADQRWAQRFARELRLGRPIRHPNVCRIFDIGEADGHRFLTMELAAGGTLRDLIKSDGRLRPLPDRMADARAAIAGLAAIHEAGIVHRDVKPDNMLRMADGRLVLSDFGLATDLSNNGPVTVMVGTPHYMAPEIRVGEPATTRSDVWSLGVVLYEIFFGVRPERKSSRSQAGMSRPPPPLTATALERALLVLAEACLAEAPFDRPGDAREVAKMLDRLTASPGSFGRRRLRAHLTIGALIGGLVFGGMGAWLRYRSHPGGETSGRSAIVIPTGPSEDWSTRAKLIAKVSGRVHCLSVVNPKTVRVVWGWPKIAEDVDVGTGARRPTGLLPETFQVDCPDASPTGAGLLYTTVNQIGAREIRLSRSADGSGGVGLTSGFDPTWLRNGEEFLYQVDDSHAAVFSLTTMKLTLLQESWTWGHYGVAEVTASRAKDLVAVLGWRDNAVWTLAIYEGARLDRRAVLDVPPITGLHFSAVGDRLFASLSRTKGKSALVEYDWRQGKARHIGRFEGADLSLPQKVEAGEVVLASRLASDVWLYGDGPRRRLTSDGENYSASMGPDGTLLVSKRADEARYNIWRHFPDGTTRQVTFGKSDIAPEFALDGKTWTYADYANGTIQLCASANDTCRAVKHDELIPSWPRISPDVRRIAYVTQAGAPKLVVLSLDTGRTQVLATVQRECPPLWSSASRIWSYEGGAARYSWVERDVLTGVKTGEQFDNEAVSNRDKELRCWPSDAPPSSPFFRRVRVEQEESAQIVLLPGLDL